MLKCDYESGVNIRGNIETSVIVWNITDGSRINYINASEVIVQLWHSLYTVVSFQDAQLLLLLLWLYSPLLDHGRFFSFLIYT
jgi:hypothetical protein